MVHVLKDLFTVRDLLDLIIAVVIAVVLVGILGFTWLVWRRRLMPQRFPLRPSKARRDLQSFIEAHARRHPEASLEHLRLYLEKVQTRNAKLSFTAHDTHITTQVSNHKPVDIRVRDGLYHADFAKPECPGGELYLSPLALIWHSCHWTLTFADERRFYRHVRKMKLFEIRKNVVYFHISMNEFSSFRKRDGVWYYAPHEARGNSKT